MNLELFEDGRLILVNATLDEIAKYLNISIDETVLLLAKRRTYLGRYRVCLTPKKNKQKSCIPSCLWKRWDSEIYRKKSEA